MKIVKSFGRTSPVCSISENRTKLDVTTKRGVSVRMNEVLLCYDVYFNGSEWKIHAQDVECIEEPDEPFFLSKDLQIGTQNDESQSTITMKHWQICKIRTKVKSSKTRGDPNRMIRQANEKVNRINIAGAEDNCILKGRNEVEKDLNIGDPRTPNMIIGTIKEKH